MSSDNNWTDQADEIDFFKLVETLWNGKLVILGCIFLCLLAGTLFVSVKKPEYRFTAPYILNYHNFQFTELEKNVPFVPPSSYFSGTKFRVNERNARITLIHDGSKSIEVINQELREENVRISEYLSGSAAMDLEVLNSLPLEYRSSEVVAASAYYKAKILNDFANGVLAFTFIRPSMQKVSNAPIVLAISACMGAFIGIFFVLFRDSYRSYQRNRKASETL